MVNKIKIFYILTFLSAFILPAMADDAIQESIVDMQYQLKAIQEHEEFLYKAIVVSSIHINQLENQIKQCKKVQ